MKKILQISIAALALTSVVAVEQGLIPPIPPQPLPTNIKEYFQLLEGTWIGGGLFELFEDASFTEANKNSRLVPSGFAIMETPDFKLKSEELRHEYMQETLQYWFLEDSNTKANQNFVGVGYIKRVWRARLDENGFLPHDDSGNPIFDADTSKPMFHQENGYILAFQDKVGTGGFDVNRSFKVNKMLSFPRGLSKQSLGTYDRSNNDLRFSMFEGDSDFGVFSLDAGTVEHVKLRDYLQFFELESGDPMNCIGLDCAIARQKYDEWFRMDQVNEDGTFHSGHFHRGRSFLDKKFSATVPLFFSPAF